MAINDVLWDLGGVVVFTDRYAIVKEEQVQGDSAMFVLKNR